MEDDVGLSGTWENKLVEDANGGISGSSVVSGTACGTSATIVGKRSGCAIRFGFSTFGSCTVEFTGDVTDRTMSGSFHVTSGFSDQGSWSGFRTN